MNREIVSEVFETLVMPHISQIVSPRKPVLSCLDYQLHDLKRQIGQGQELLDSGRSVNPGQLSAQLAILSKQRAGLLAKRGGLEASS